MTLEEKAALCVGAGPWATVAVERLFPFGYGGSYTTTVTIPLELPCILSRESTFHKWLEDPRGKAVLGQCFRN
jgi:hypothetical protein